MISSRIPAQEPTKVLYFTVLTLERRGKQRCTNESDDLYKQLWLPFPFAYCTRRITQISQNSNQECALTREDFTCKIASDAV